VGHGEGVRHHFRASGLDEGLINKGAGASGEWAAWAAEQLPLFCDRGTRAPGAPPVGLLRPTGSTR
jgi:hypothetical protein